MIHSQSDEGVSVCLIFDKQILQLSFLQNANSMLAMYVSMMKWICTACERFLWKQAGMLLQCCKISIPHPPPPPFGTSMEIPRGRGLKRQRYKISWNFQRGGIGYRYCLVKCRTIYLIAFFPISLQSILEPEKFWLLSPTTTQFHLKPLLISMYSQKIFLE